jgi:hypothetical protein
MARTLIKKCNTFFAPHDLNVDVDNVDDKCSCVRRHVSEDPPWSAPILVSLSSAPAQAQPLGQAKVAINFAYSSFFLHF